MDRLRYIIIPIKIVTKEMIDNVIETSLDTLRISKNGNTILKWRGNKPKCLWGKGYEPKDIRIELSKDEWQDDIEV